MVSLTQPQQLFKNRKQKLIWSLYIIFLFINWNSVVNHNSRYACSSGGHNCYSLISTSLVLTVMFIVAALLMVEDGGKKWGANEK